jgi:hypothetical protein
MTIVGQLSKKIGAVMEFDRGVSGTIARLRLPITGAGQLADRVVPRTKWPVSYYVVEASPAR